jgi:lipopolysaccharide export system permease protein
MALGWVGAGEPIMSMIERYVLRRTGRSFLLILASLVGTLWVTQVLRELDVLTAKGQGIWVFLVITLLALPALVQVAAPIALLAAILATLNSLNADSELPVISAGGGSRKAVMRPILLLAVIVTAFVALSHHVLAPASLAAFRGLITQVRADVIATLVQDGGFRSVDDQLTMHIREKAPDGSFEGVFVNDDRNPAESLQYVADRGMMVERAGGSFLVLQNGELIRESKEDRKSSVVAFETYALDLSQLGAGSGAAVYRAKERSTFYLLQPEVDDEFSNDYPGRVAAELHDRITAPLYTLVFALIALAFLGEPSTSRQDRTVSLVLAILLSLALRAGGFAAGAAASATGAAIPMMYAVPGLGLILGGGLIIGVDRFKRSRRISQRAFSTDRAHAEAKA